MIDLCVVDLCEVDLGRVVDQPVCHRPSCLAVDLCDGRPACVVDLVRKAYCTQSNGPSTAVLTSEPAINLSERWLRELLFQKSGSMAAQVPCIRDCLLGCVDKEEIRLWERVSHFTSQWFIY